jgi:antitoxin component of MazEF toxin-antitoxin module
LEENRELEARYDHDTDDQTIHTTKSTRDKLADALARLEMIVINPTENSEMMVSPDPRYDTYNDDQSIQTTKSTREKLDEALARLKMMSLKPPEHIGMMISPDPKTKAPAITEATGTEADSTGNKA